MLNCLLRLLKLESGNSDWLDCLLTSIALSLEWRKWKKLKSFIFSSLIEKLIFLREQMILIFQEMNIHPIRSFRSCILLTLEIMPIINEIIRI